MKRREQLEAIYEEYHTPDLLHLDPLSVVREYLGTPELELVALFAAVISYGRVERIVITLRSVLARIGALIPFVMDTSFEEKVTCLDGIKHRFNDHVDMALFFEVSKIVYKRWGSIESCVADADVKTPDQLVQIVSDTYKAEALRLYGEKKESFSYLFPSPSGKSACKRICMFLRWMVRADDGIDCGLWHTVSPELLTIPVDTHVLKIAQKLRLTRRKNGSWTAAREITDKLLKIDPTDPVRFDFSLCHWGMVKHRVPEGVQ